MCNSGKLLLHWANVADKAYCKLAAKVVMIPISIAVIGTCDATLIALSSPQGITAESALSYSPIVLTAIYFLYLRCDNGGDSFAD